LIWYEKTKFPIPQIPQGSDEDKIRFLIGKLESNTEKLKEKFHIPFESLVPIKYGDFQLPKDLHIPHHVIPDRHFNSIEGFKSNDQQAMVKRIEDYYKMKGIFPKKACHLKVVPVCLVPDGEDRRSISTWIKSSCPKG
jgi:hypothetical protein